MKHATLSRKLRERQKITYKHLKLNRKEDKMKDINDIDKTIDWIDEEELTENERKFLENREALAVCADLFTLPRNLPHSVALNNLIDRTITHILNN
jgi:hypothetical protein